MYTYVVISKKTYLDLSTSTDKEVYEIIRVLNNQDEANDVCEQYEAYCGMLLNKIDINGILLHVETKSIVFEGTYDMDQVTNIFNRAPEVIWNRGKRVR